MKFCILGAGSAGLMTALAVKRAFPQTDVSLVYSSQVPVIGVGESTTVLFPPFVHRSLGIDLAKFFHDVQPGWKLGVRFEWGAPEDTHFNYPFDAPMSSKRPAMRKMPAFYCMEDWQNASRAWRHMDANQPPTSRRANGQIHVDLPFGYHIDNARLIKLLTQHAQQQGIRFVDSNVQDVILDNQGNVIRLQLESQPDESADLFFDCSGFHGRLLKQALGEPVDSYEPWLFCDHAIVGRQGRRSTDVLRPYTTVETMNCGWCWRIDFPQHVTRGYVYSSQFCTDQEASDELGQKYPELIQRATPIHFPRGRCQRFWVNNVVAIGNASGFVEPLEATALHLVIEQIRLVLRILDEADMQPTGPRVKEAANRRFRLLWDEVRDFLAVHYRFNRRSDSRFWQHCRQSTDLGGATELVALYQEAGPSTMTATLLPGGHVFGYDGFMAMLVGMRVPTRFRNRFTKNDQERWDATRRNEESPHR